MNASSVAARKKDNPHFSGAVIVPSERSSCAKYSRVPSTCSISGVNANHMKTNDTAAIAIVNGSSRVTHVMNRNSCEMTVCCRSLIVSRLGAPPSGVQNPPTLVPHAIAMTSAEPNTLLPMSSMPMKRSIARTTGIIAAATTVFGRNALKNVAMANHTMICRRVLVPTPISDTSAMRRSSPHRVQTVERMLAPSSRKISSSEYDGRILATGRKLKMARTTSGRNPVTARLTGSKIHHHAIQTSSPRLPRTG